MRVRTIIAGGLALGCYAAVGAAPPVPTAKPAATAASAAPVPRHLVVVSVDTLRADRLGCYGHDRPTSPAIDALAAAGVRFAEAWATSPWTKPSHASLYTGLYPTRNGATTMAATLAAKAPHMAELLAGHGYHTLAVVNTGWLRRQGLERGFARLDYVPYVQGRRESPAVTDTAIAALADRPRDRPLFLLAHYMSVHSDYKSLPRYEQMFVRPYDGFVDGSTQQLYRYTQGLFEIAPRDVAHLLDLYDAGIRQVDDEIGRLVGYLRTAGILDNALVVLLSDHGEEFLDHGSVIHGHTQYREVIRIPLILHGPGLPAGRVVAAPVSLIDVLPTSLALLGQPVPQGLDGIRLDALWGDEPGAPRLVFSEADVTYPPPGPGLVPIGPHRAVRYGRFKLHFRTDTRQVRLFDLDADPREQHDVAGRYRELSALLREHLERFLVDGSLPRLDATVRGKLDAATRPAAGARRTGRAVGAEPASHAATRR